MTDQPGDQYKLRLPQGMRDQIAELAKANGRSINAEITIALEQYLGAMPNHSARTRADRLKQARQAAGFPTASEAARALGVTPSTYIHHENGTRDFGEDAATLYAKSFNVSVARLMLGEPDQSSTPKPYNARLDTFVAAALSGLIASGKTPLDEILVRDAVTIAQRTIQIMEAEQ